MRTNIVLDDELVGEAFRYAEVATKRELVELALREFVDNRCRRDVRELRGNVRLRAGYDHKALRQGVYPRKARSRVLHLMRPASLPPAACTW